MFSSHHKLRIWPLRVWSTDGILHKYPPKVFIWNGIYMGNVIIIRIFYFAVPSKWPVEISIRWRLRKPFICGNTHFDYRYKKVIKLRKYGRFIMIFNAPHGFTRFMGGQCICVAYQLEVKGRTLRMTTNPWKRLREGNVLIGKKLKLGPTGMLRMKAVRLPVVYCRFVNIYRG